jgi:hypothetical protein
MNLSVVLFFIVFIGWAIISPVYLSRLVAKWQENWERTPDGSPIKYDDRFFITLIVTYIYWGIIALFLLLIIFYEALVTDLLSTIILLPDTLWSQIGKRYKIKKEYSIRGLATLYFIIMLFYGLFNMLFFGAWWAYLIDRLW